MVAEKSLEMFNFTYDESIGTPFLESIVKQGLNFHIFDAKVIKDDRIYVLVLLSACGLVIMKYTKETNWFEVVTSEVLNINCLETV